MNKKNIGVIILVIVLIALCGYLYSGVTKCKAVATDLGTQLQECGAGVDQLEAGLDECMAGATQCQEALTNLQQMCAPYLPTE